MRTTSKFLLKHRAVKPLCTVFVVAILTTGCVTDPVTGKQVLDPKLAGVGAGGAGALVGGLIGNAVGGRDGAWIGVLAGGAIGASTGYFLTKYLNEQEQQEYLANLSQRMSATPASAKGFTSWGSVDRMKTADSSFTGEMPLQQISGRTGRTLNPNNIASLPQNTNCRIADTTIKTKTGEQRLSGVWCRNANGDYVNVDNATT